MPCARARAAGSGRGTVLIRRPRPSESAATKSFGVMIAVVGHLIDAARRARGIERPNRGIGHALRMNNGHRAVSRTDAGQPPKTRGPCHPRQEEAISFSIDDAGPEDDCLQPDRHLRPHHLLGEPLAACVEIVFLERTEGSVLAATAGRLVGRLPSVDRHRRNVHQAHAEPARGCGREASPLDVDLEEALPRRACGHQRRRVDDTVDAGDSDSQVRGSSTVPRSGVAPNAATCSVDSRLRASATTASPRARSARITGSPTSPVPPVTSTLTLRYPRLRRGVRGRSRGCLRPSRGFPVAARA